MKICRTVLTMATLLCTAVQAAAQPAENPASPQELLSQLRTEYPPHEQELLTIFDAAAKTEEGADPADTRLRMQIQLSNYMWKNQQADNWLGIVKLAHATQEGDMRLTIEIAPGVTISTYENRELDGDRNTLVRRSSPLWPGLSDMKIGENCQLQRDDAGPNTRRRSGNDT